MATDLSQQSFPDGIGIANIRGNQLGEPGSAASFSGAVAAFVPSAARVAAMRLVVMGVLGESDLRAACVRNIMEQSRGLNLASRNCWRRLPGNARTSELGGRSRAAG